MREEDEVVVYLVVVGTVESVDRQFLDELRRIHHSYRKFGYMFEKYTDIDHIDVSAANRVYEIDQGTAEAVRRSFVPTSLPPHRIPLHLGLWLRILT